MHELLSAAYDKVSNATALYLHSAGKVPPFDPQRPYSPDELEPYDALVTRFERTIEVFLKFFRTAEMFETAGSGSTVRDCLGLMGKLGLVCDVDFWMEMRKVRNRISHDYLPEKIQGIYELLIDVYRPEVARALAASEAYLRSSRER
jgi:hypothetical protein